MRLTTTALGILVLGLAACASDAERGRPTIGELSQGLNVFSKSADEPLSGAYVKGDVVVYFETRSGGVPEELALGLDPDAPALAVDYRFMDDQGEVFMSSMAGDGFIDPTWAADMKVRGERHDPLRRIEEFKMARAVGLELAGEVGAGGAARDFQFERVVLADMAASIKDDDWGMVPTGEPLKAPIEFETQDETGAYHVVSGYPYDHHHQLYGKCIFACFGDHSATRVYTLAADSWSYYTVHDNKNHGDTASTMSCWGSYNSCTGSSGGCGNPYANGACGGTHRSNYVNDPYETNGTAVGSDNTGSAACRTPYSWDSSQTSSTTIYNNPDGTVCPSSWIGTNDGCDVGCTVWDPDCGDVNGHNCHDDSVIQMRAVINNAGQPKYTNVCHNSPTHWKGPGNGTNSGW